ncbi:hypothetical protein HELRODRAFT_72429 [Helobdella robusta]|uniref:Cytochrome P450 n=1 Tax=Helobdella robusta TaxID=6412 RepID=T1G0Z9_HELRO|nr:hypothetical protein HELRODRAFT_72429 [Helobdella robusta]ESO10865.1 hypothetical protein HELRODRAFT_72429 [Helobdella robusta]
MTSPLLSLLSSLTTTNLFLLAALFIIPYLLIFKRRKLPEPVITGDGTKYKHPPCLPTVPIFGSVPFLPAFPTQYKYFTKEKYKYGDVVAFYVMGRCYKIVLNSKEAIHDAFVKKSTDFAGRPSTKLNSILNPNQKGILFHNYDESFKKYHKLSLGIMKQFGFGNRVMEKRIMEEMSYFMENLASFKGLASFRNTIFSFSMNIVCGILFGRRFSDNDPELSDVINSIRTNFNNLGKLFVANVFPFIKMYDDSYYRKIPHHHHEPSQEEQENSKRHPPSSFIRSYVKIEGPDYDKEQLLYFMYELFLAGTETVASTLEWTLVLLANNLEIQEKMYRELKKVLSDKLENSDKNKPESKTVQRSNLVNHKTILPTLEDKTNLLYCQAVFYEILRYKPATPMTLPHVTLKDSHVMGYFVPKGTTVIGNLHGSHNDTRVWHEPELFNPDRFIDVDTGMIINKDHIVPFSLGKRSCFGEILARQEVFLSLTNLVWRFKILPPSGQQEVKVDDVMDVTSKPSSFKIRLVERE